MKLFDEYKGLGKANYILFAGRVATSMGSMIWSMQTLILRQKLGMDAAAIGMVVLAVSLSQIPLSILGGKLADRCSRKMLIVCCDLVSICGFFWCAFMGLNMVNMVLFCIAGLFQGMEYPAYSSLVADVTPSKDREKAYSLNYLGMNLGMILSPTIAGFLFQNYLWLAFFLNGLSIAVSTFLIFFFLKEPEKKNEETPVYEKGDTRDSIWRVLGSNRILILFIVTAGISSTILYQVSYLLPIDLTAAHGDQGALIYGTITSLNCIIVVIFTPIITRIFKRVSGLQKMFIGLSLTLTGYLIFRIFLGIIPFYYAAYVFTTWGEIFCTIMSDTYLSRRIPETHRGRVISISSVAGNLIFAPSEYLEGLIYDHFGSWATWSTVILVGIICLCMITVLMRMDRKKFPLLYTKTDVDSYAA